MSSIIKFDTLVLDLIEKDGDKFLVDPKAEEALQKWYEFKKAVEEADKIFKDKLIDNMKKLNTVRIEGQSMRVTRRYFGDRYELSNKDSAKELGLAKEVVWIKPDAKAIDTYVEEVGDLPDCVALKDRTESIVMSKIKDNDKSNS